MKKKKLGIKKITLRNLDEEQLAGIVTGDNGTGVMCYVNSGNTNCGCYGSAYACTGSCNNTGCCASATCPETQNFDATCALAYTCAC